MALIVNSCDFVEEIVTNVKRACRMEGIKQGAIGVCIAPVLESEADWAGVPVGCIEVLHTASIKDNGDTLCYKDDGSFVGDAAGVVAMKIAAAKRLAVKYDAENLMPPKEEYTSGALPDDMLGNGISNWKGAIAIPVGVLSRFGFGCGCCFKGIPAFYVIVAVSGGTEDQDEAAALTAISTVSEFVNGSDEYMLSRGF